MFGFGKKKLDERLMAGIAIETAMFMRWMGTHGNRKLTPPEVNDIVRGILERENLKFTAGEQSFLVLSASTHEAETIDKFRNKFGFDETVEGFCKSIGIPWPAK